MKIAYIDAYAGVSGDMLLGALIDFGWSIEELQNIVKGLGLEHEVVLHKERVQRRGVSGLKLTVETKDHHSHRHLSEIIDRIRAAGLSEAVQEKAIAVFRCLAEAEAYVHGTTPEMVHFHEVGAADAMVDIVGVCQGMHSLGIEKVFYSPIRVGGGFVECAHGKLPVPAPATAILLKEMTVFGGDVDGEWATPTGTSLLKILGSGVPGIPSMSLQGVGIGAGSADPIFKNLLRIFVGQVDGDPEEVPNEREVVSIIETTIDDMSGEYYPFIMEKLLKLPVCDVYLTPVIMKKGRPGYTLTVIADSKNLDDALYIIFKETSTFGVRIKETKRITLNRVFMEIPWRGRSIRVKIGYWRGDVVQVSPEYEECKLAAIENNMELKSVYEEVLTLVKNKVV